MIKRRSEERRDDQGEGVREKIGRGDLLRFREGKGQDQGKKKRK